MLQALRDKSSGWIATVILGLLIIPFAFFGMEQYLFQRNDTFAAKIQAPPTWWPAAPDWWPVRKLLWTSEEISTEEFRSGFENARQAQRQAQGEAYDARRFESIENKQEVLSDLIDQRVIRMATERSGFAVGNAQVRGVIESIPGFQVDGKFDVKRYQLAIASMSPARTPTQFDEEIRKNLQQRILATQLQGSAFVTASEGQRLLRLLTEKRDVSYAVLPAPAQDAAPVTAAEIARWYKDHPENFRAPETVTLEYVDIDGNALPAPPAADADTLLDRYKQEKNRFIEQEQRLTSHILIKVDAKADAAAQKAAEAKAQQLLAQAKGGADFAGLARQNSEDAGSKETGGDLGWIQKGAMVKPFEDAVFGMQAGEIRGPIKTEFGWHIIQVREIKAGKEKSFDEARPEVERLVAETARERAYNDLTGKLVDQVLKSPTSLGPAARASNLTVQRIGPFARGKGTGIAANPAVMRVAFSDTAKTDKFVSDPIEIGQNHSVLIRVVDYTPERVQPLAQVGNQVVAAIRAERMTKAAAVDAEAMLSRLQKGETLAAVAASRGLTPINAPGVARGAPIPDPAASEAYFEVPSPTATKPSTGKAKLSSGQYLMFAVTKVSDNNVGEVTPEQRAGFLRDLAPRIGEQDAKALVEAQRKLMKIETAPDRL